MLARDTYPGAGQESAAEICDKPSNQWRRAVACKEQVELIKVVLNVVAVAALHTNAQLSSFSCKSLYLISVRVHCHTLQCPADANLSGSRRQVL